MSYISFMALSPVYIEPQVEYDLDLDGSCTDTCASNGCQVCLISEYEITCSIQHLSSTLSLEEHLIKDGKECSELIITEEKVIKQEIQEVASSIDTLPLTFIDNNLDRNYLDFVFFTDKKSFRHINDPDSKVMFIMRGLPGSGKSSLVSVLKSAFHNVTVCSADDYFYTEDGSYNHDVNLLHAAHEDCQSKASQACSKQTPVVVIDNTNVRKWEMKFYFQLAATNGYTVILVEPKTPWKMDPHELANRNSHGVTVEVLEKKVSMFEKVIPGYYAWFPNEKMSDYLRQISEDIYTQCLTKLKELRADFMNAMNINPDHISEEMTQQVLQRYYAQSEKKRPLLHCTAKYCGWGKVPDSSSYFNRSDVQNACGKVFDLTVTGLIITLKTVAARVSLNGAALALFSKPEEDSWITEVKGSYSKQNPDVYVSASKRKLKKLTKPSKLEKELKKFEQTTAGRKKSKQRKQKGGLKNSNKTEKTIQGVEENENNNSVDQGLLPSQEQDQLEGGERFQSSFLQDQFPHCRITGKGRSAHFTLKTALGVESKQTNFDILKACDLECSLNAEQPLVVPVTQGVACYYGNGMCCVYFTKPLKVQCLYSGYY